jgi:hypothetical protein
MMANIGHRLDWFLTEYGAPSSQWLAGPLFVAHSSKPQTPSGIASTYNLHMAYVVYAFVPANVVGTRCHPQLRQLGSK